MTKFNLINTINFNKNDYKKIQNKHRDVYFGNLKNETISIIL